MDKNYGFRRGARDGLPIALGYFTVSVSLGLALRAAGLTAFQGGLMSASNMTSAGQFAAAGVIAAGSSYFLLASMQLLINARYLLMSCALSQRLSPDCSLGQRLLLGLTVTDEIFGISIAAPGRYLRPSYSLGALAVACPGWTLGTVCGALMGEVLPERLVRALGVALFGMLIAVFMPKTKESRPICIAVLCAMGASFLCTKLPFVSQLSEGARLLILTVLISFVAAVLAPLPKAWEEAGAPAAPLPEEKKRARA